MLSEIQRDFRNALLDVDAAVPRSLIATAGAHAASRFNVYRNNVAVSLVNALRDRFPVVEKIVGDEFFAAMARVYVGGHLPVTPLLVNYGDTFADFIASFEPASELPYLPGVARLEAARTRAYHAADGEPVDPDRLRDIEPEQLFGATFKLHPSLQLVRSKFPIVTIWAMNSGLLTLQPIDENIPEDALVARPRLDVVVRKLPDDGAALLQRLADGRPLGDAIDAAGAGGSEFKLEEILAILIEAGAFASVSTTQPGRS